MAFNIFQKKKDTKTASHSKNKGGSSIPQIKDNSLDISKKSKETKKDVKIVNAGNATRHHNIIIRPRITEKATNVTSDGIYVFDIAPYANKTQVRDAIKEIYNITPRKINISIIQKKKVLNRKTGSHGVKSGGKKAYVYLKKGDNIQFV